MHVEKLISIRKRFMLNYKSEVNVRKAYNDLYAAIIDKKIAMKVGVQRLSAVLRIAALLSG